MPQEQEEGHHSFLRLCGGRVQGKLPAAGDTVLSGTSRNG